MKELQGSNSCFVSQWKLLPLALLVDCKCTSPTLQISPAVPSFHSSSLQTFPYTLPCCGSTPHFLLSTSLYTFPTHFMYICVEAWPKHVAKTSVFLHCSLFSCSFIYLHGVTFYNSMLGNYHTPLLSVKQYT